MSGAEDDEKELELKDLIVQTLESNGLLAKIKAQLRASVFLALDENEKDTKNNNYANLKIKKLLATNEGREAVSLVRDFLEVCNLDFTISVFDPELNSNILMDKKDRLIKNLNLDEDEMNKDNPILVEYLKQSKQKKSSFSNTISEELSSTAVETLKSRFDKLDFNKRKSVEKDKIKNLFLNLFANFNKGMIERFVVDEMENINENSVNFDEFLKIYKKFYNLCINVTNNSNLNTSLNESNEFKNNADKFGFITSRNTTSKANSLDPFVKVNNTKNGDQIDEALSSSSSSSISSNSAFKRDKPKQDKSNTNTKQQNDTKKKSSYLDDNIEEFNDVEVLKPTKTSTTAPAPTTKSTNPFDNDDFFSSANKTSKSTLGELPPLTNSNFQNKFFTSKEADKKLNIENDDYDDDFTNGTTPRTPKFERKTTKNRSALGSDEEIEENISYVEENSKFDEGTIDKSISTIQGNNDADYIEDISL